ncbi:recombinase family protein [uncultured Gemmiger sp.]|uniref:recombinase family protein n=1 Tax=uncultured Gemmiger sp. TaxID=1623490 RepID=UPI0025D534C1|nr:recombinase family protein [uncultured Gemmiger sp.]
MKSRKNTGGQGLVEAAIYLRLSNADGPAAESDSIQNQRAFLTEWAARNHFLITREFVDDGHTGTDFERPGFQELTACLMDGSVRCILVRDLSRLGRNYTETGRYLEQIFPRMGVRFIAVNDQYDSAKNTDSAQQMAVFKNVFNDFYAADASSKVRSSLNILKRQGKFLGGQAPYGYRIDPQDKYHLLPNAETAPIVQRIFALFLGGTSRTKIAGILNREGIPSPAVYKKLTDKSRQFTGLWNAETIRRILSHPVYQGDMAQQFTRMVSYKVHERRRVDPSEWIVVPDTHEPLVSREDFALAQKMQSVRTYQTTDHPHLLTGIAYCADCGSPLYAKKRGKYWYLNCYGYYRDPTMRRCTSHSIREDVVVQAVLDALRDLAKGRVDPEALARRKLESRQQKETAKTIRHRLEQQLEKARRTRLSAYKDKAAGVLNEKEFTEISEALRREEEQCRQQLDQLKAAEDQSGQEHQLEERIRAFLQFDHLEKAQLQQLVRRVTVDSQKHITITFTFADPEKAD